MSIGKFVGLQYTLRVFCPLLNDQRWYRSRNVQCDSQIPANIPSTVKNRSQALNRSSIGWMYQSTAEKNASMVAIGKSRVD